MIRRVKLYARVNVGGTFKRIPVQFDRNGRASEPKTNGGDIVSYAVRIAGRFEHAGETLPAAVATLHEKQALIGIGTAVAPSATIFAGYARISSAVMKSRTVGGSSRATLKILLRLVSATWKSLAPSTVSSYQRIRILALMTQVSLPGLMFPEQWTHPKRRK